MPKSTMCLTLPLQRLDINFSTSGITILNLVLWNSPAAWSTFSSDIVLPSPFGYCQMQNMLKCTFRYSLKVANKNTCLIYPSVYDMILIHDDGVSLFC